MNFMNDIFNKNKAVFEDTMKILETRSYTVNGKYVLLKLAPSRMRNISLFLPGMINALEDLEWENMEKGAGKTSVHVVNQDSFAAALQMKTSDKPVLVLNLANALRPGGGVTKGSSAQEEDLCRRSSLYKSLSGSIASDYYNYNKGLSSPRLGSNAIMVTPEVEIIKDEQGNLLDETHIVAVMTCAAPDLRDKEHGGTTMHGLSDEQHRSLLYTRISGMFRTAAYLGYRNLVLGAFGCGAFRNDPQIVAQVFRDVMNEFTFHGKKLEDLFDQITFAVLSRHNNGNYDVFRAALEAEDVAEEVTETIPAELTMQDKIRGSLFGGAVGDALGYAIEFDKEPVIFHRYGKSGITSYELDKNGKALISDDTQMSLFTAEGILFGETRSKMRGVGGPLSIYVEGSYQAWLITQEESFKHIHSTGYMKDNYKNSSWLLDVPELYARRAPGNTCLQGLHTRQSMHGDFIANPINNSKGCGGVMRTAPLALRFARETRPDIGYLDREAAEMAAITHSHPLGYLPSAVLNHVLIGILRMNRGDSLKDIVLEAKEAAAEQFKDIKDMTVLAQLIDRAVSLAESGKPDLECIHELGEGWVAEEALAIALYCTLKYPYEFSKAIIASVNHKGDSDSTGAITGNLVGALVGYDAIEEKWKENLELKDIILEVADDLYNGCTCHEYSEVIDPVWMCKYGKRRRYVPEVSSTEIRMIRGDITKVDTEAIVNAANSTLLGGGGVDGAIHRAAGPELLKECRTLNGCKTGEAKITGAYKLPCKYVIHTVGPVWYGGTHGEEQDLAACYRNSLELAVANNIRTIAFPSISTGVYSYPLKQAAKTAVKTVRAFLKEHPSQLDLVEWVLFDEVSYQTYVDALAETE